MAESQLLVEDTIKAFGGLDIIIANAVSDLYLVAAFLCIFLLSTSLLLVAHIMPHPVSSNQYSCLSKTCSNSSISLGIHQIRTLWRPQRPRGGRLGQSKSFGYPIHP
jgi:hypothetical protein